MNSRRCPLMGRRCRRNAEEADFELMRQPRLPATTVGVGITSVIRHKLSDAMPFADAAISVGLLVRSYHFVFLRRSVGFARRVNDALGQKPNILRQQKAAVARDTAAG